MPEKAPLLEVRGLDVFYGGIHALRSVDISLAEGEIVSIIGANGAGKSTLLKTIAGVKEKVAGSIHYRGRPLPSGSARVVKSGISLVPEGRRIFPNLTVKENLLVGAYPRREAGAALKPDLDEVFSLFPRLKERLNQPGGTLSGGEQQMLAIGRALMARPKLLLLDEPSLGLAPILVDDLFERVKRVNAEAGLTILLVEQNAFVALEIAVRAYVIETGEIKREGPGAVLLDDPLVQESYLGVSRA
ncbi:MAG: ABC transporter ATP-binding protein [Bacillota bacterium]